MAEIILQYTLIVLLVVGLGYLVHILKDKGINLEDDYFGLTYAVLNTLQSDEATKDNIKVILRLVSGIVKEVEVNYKDSDNNHKENQALSIAKKTIKELGFESPIDDDSIRYIIRLAAVMLPGKDETNEKTNENLNREEMPEIYKDNK